MANDGKLWRILSAFGPVVISVVLSVKLGPFASNLHKVFTSNKTECKCCNNFKVSYVLN